MVLILGGPSMHGSSCLVQSISPDTRASSSVLIVLCRCVGLWSRPSGEVTFVVGPCDNFGVYDVMAAL